MMYTRTYTRVSRVEHGENEKEILDAYGKLQLKNVTDKIWNHSKFVYANRNPKPAYSESERAMKYETDPNNLSISIYNTATNKYGTAYAQYVHLAGKAKSDLLMFEIQADMAKNSAKVSRAITYDRFKSAKMVTTEVASV